MDRANTAEWILRRVITPSRAAEIVGDLLETHPNMGNLGFSFSIAKLLIVLGWRTTVGILCAAIAGVTCSWIPFAFAVTRLAPAGRQAAHFHANQYIAASMLLWMAAAFSLIRFGIRSRLSMLSMLGALIGTVAVCTYWLPNATPVLFVATAAILLLSLITVRGRQVMATLIPALAIGSSSIYLLGMIPLNPRWPGWGWLALSELLLVTTAECRALSFLHERLSLDTKSASLLHSGR